jgi:colanic acid/amylovoran biosynthesis glycosyltransferase
MGDSSPEADEPPNRLRVAYVMSRFPKLTETFVLNEIIAVDKLGVAAAVYPLLRQRETLLQPGAAELVERAHYLPSFSVPILASQLYFLRRKPRAYLGALGALIRATLGSARLLAAGLLLFPKIVHAARLMAGTGIDHVHCHFATHPALAGFVIHRLVDIPYSFTAHGSDIHLDRHMLCEKVAEASFVVAISETNREVIERECGARHAASIKVIHCGVDTTLFRPPHAPLLDGRSDALRIVSVGTLHEVKGQRHLIEACALIRDEGVEFSCRLIGNGPDEADLRRLVARHALDGHISFLGVLSRDEVVAQLVRADVLVAASVPSSDGRREGIPVVLMEAMSCGLPVVASRLSGIPELVRDGRSGILVTPGNATEIAAALRRLAKDPDLRRRLGTGARRTVERAFDLEANAAELIKLFRTAQA